MSKGALSATRLARMHHLLAGYVERGSTPGLVSLIDRRGETDVEVIGTQAIDGEPMQRDTIFRIASMTKPVTAAATMILVEECVLRLDDPVDRFLPELADRRVLKAIDGPIDDTVPANRPITLRDLLTFTPGYGLLMVDPRHSPIAAAMSEQGVAVGPPSPKNHLGTEEWIKRLGTMPLLHQPGEQWMYNTGAEILSVLISRASGQRFETFLQERIFGPLGMKDTSFVVPADKLDRLSTAYWTNAETGELIFNDGPADSEWSRTPAFEDGGAGLVSTVDDFLAFSRMLLNHGSHGDERILSRPSIELMTSDQLTDLQKQASTASWLGESHSWGFGMSIVTRRDQVAHSVGTYGWDGGLGTSWYADPREEMTTILLTNASWTSPFPPDLFRDFWTSAYQTLDD